MSAAGLVVPALDSTLGAAFLGHFVSAVLYGLTTLQAYTYYRNRSSDGWFTRYSILLLWLLDGLHVTLVTHTMYVYCVSNFTNLLAIQKPVWSICVMIMVSSASNTLVRACFAYRIYKLGGGRWIIPAVIAICSAYVEIDATYFAVKLLGLDSYAQISKFSWGLYAGLSVEVAVDLIVAATQVLLLQSYRTGIRNTDNLIASLMAYSVNTGLLTSFCALGALVSYAVAPHKFIYFAFYFVLSKMYINSLLATLNSRSLVRKTRPAGKFRTAGTSVDPTHGGVEFTTVITAGISSSDMDDAVISSSGTQLDEERGKHPKFGR
ncbi:uncharacterized protein BXZ73DRAFT_99886 [Epithele typhae]|uniref:uncharacterized protein n=1 Tax=Epithele typhae TaxID=378194 RepID=UPI002007AF92|nr:uncharacterized protein BXZ73DRAFT_99886 [Epithele typhae]KAH9938825.1 hypothetical protein BXZ73DRAFT_99886 [Epithele typhae]